MRVHARVRRPGYDADVRPRRRPTPWGIIQRLFCMCKQYRHYYIFTRNRMRENASVSRSVGIEIEIEIESRGRPSVVLCVV